MTTANAPQYCPACGEANRCAVAAGAPAAECWCMRGAAQLPLPAAGDARCYCPTCLTAAGRDAQLRR